MLLLLPSDAPAQPKVPDPDHGVVLATAMEVAPGKLKDTINLADTTNYVFRGRVISLDKERTVSLCFDTEQMRVAGVWVGKPVVWTANKNMGPAVEGKMLFATRPGPGWAKDGKWDDPRKGSEGPLPRDWAHYRGYYLHGDKVVLSYTVGKCPVLEMPGHATLGAAQAITRTFKLGPSPDPQTLLVCEEAGAKGGVMFPPGKAKVSRLGRLDVQDGLVLAGVVNEPLGFKWEVKDGRMLLKLPALKQGASFKLIVARLPANANYNDFGELFSGEPEDLSALTRGGPPRWDKVIDTKGSPATSTKEPYVVDNIGLPETNPWNASIRMSGLDFFDDGRAALCTWDGDVWIVSGLDDKLAKVRWKRFASGLQQPLGLKIIKGVIHTAGRDQITRLHDLNGDGEADFYENLNNDAGLTLQRHEFVMDLQTDADGNLYYCRSGHYIMSKRGDNCCVYKLSPDGSKLEVLARGFREPNGMSIGPDGTMIVSDNEGNGIPQSPLYLLKPGLHYGFTPADKGGPNKATWKYTQLPIVWLPKTVDRSAGSQVWVTSDKWGPMKGQLLHTSYGHCALFAVLIDRKAEPWQAAVWQFPLPFSSGVMRARFAPHDGQLYLCGLRGWDTNAVKDGQFCRVRYTGAKTPVPVGFQVTKAGLEITFSGPLDKDTATDDQNWAGDWSDPFPTPGRVAVKKQEMPIKGLKLSADGKTVTVELERVLQVVNFTMQYQVRAADGAAVKGALHGTIHRVP
jgi:hypothetical protein